MSSAIISNGFEDCITSSRSFSICCRLLIFFSNTRIYGFSSSAVIFSELVTKYGDIYPLSKFIPSTTSTSKTSLLFASSTVITPSFPTFSKAFAIFLPMSESPFAEIVATCAISSDDDIVLEEFFISLSTLSLAASIPLFRSIGFIPAVTAFTPSLAIDSPSTIVVVVPSPALSLVLLAASFKT
jgi:hypothetical protein